MDRTYVVTGAGSGQPPCATGGPAAIACDLRSAEMVGDLATPDGGAEWLARGALRQ